MAKDAERDKRLADALRANLRLRKAQQRSGTPADEPAGDEAADLTAKQVSEGRGGS